jgi:hypothetical protein
MATFGIDTSGNASDLLLTTALPWISGQPKFWGRYFSGTDDQNYQYDPSENKFLSQQGIPVLCFARQTSSVNEDGNAATHANANMQGVITAFGAQYLLSKKISPILYLDLEPEDAPDNILSVNYYKNWSSALVAGVNVAGGTIRFRPAVYLNQGSSKQSWQNLNTACAGGAVCVGISIARYVSQDGPDPCVAPPLTANNMVWNDAEVTPEPNPLPTGQANANLPLLVWQYYGDYPSKRLPDGQCQGGDVDFELVNPAYEAVVLSGVVPPPVTDVA